MRDSRKKIEVSKQGSKKQIIRLYDLDEKSNKKEDWKRIQQIRIYLIYTLV